MRSCDPSAWKRSEAILHVLNGDYPEADVKRMSLTGLEKFVGRLVQCTAEVDGAAGPKWWPSGLVFSRAPELGLEERERLLKRLIASCSQFFRECSDENREDCKRARVDDAPSRKRAKAPVAPEAPPVEHQFLNYFKLSTEEGEMGQSMRPQATPGALKLTACINIPFSSDVGRVMAARERHRMPEDLKLRRLERSEWYTNKAAPRTAGDVEYEQCGMYKEHTHAHSYKMPKRQHHQKRLSLHHRDFLVRFCAPLVVHLDRLDLDKVKTKMRNDSRRELVVVIGHEEKLCCDIRSSANVVRTSSAVTEV